MTQKFQLGDQVQWISQAGGVAKKKVGTVVEVVRAFNGPQTKGIKTSAMYRDHTSYVVEAVTKRRMKVYWPLVKYLSLVSDAKSVLLPDLPVKPVDSTKLVNHFVICLDKSGSMQSLVRDVINAFNENCKSIREGAESSGQDSTISLITFGDTVNVEYMCRGTTSLEDLTEKTYRPAGLTPLFDAVNEGIIRLQARKDIEDPNVSCVFIVLTDGHENRSRTTAVELNKKIREVQLTDRWSFAFLLPPGNAQYFCRNHGIPEGNVQEWEATARGLQNAREAITQGLSSYYTSRSVGRTSTKGFFVTDMSKVSTKKVKTILQDISSKVDLLEVNKTEQIRDLVESALRVNYLPGRAFYQLMKKETIQPHKKIMLRDRVNGAIYGGDEARSLLSLPSNLDVKVQPGDHGSWDIFIQSTSVNRKLVPGTKLVYLK